MEKLVKRFEVHERGIFAGVWPGNDKAEALEEMARAHGYKSFAEARDSEWRDFVFTVTQIGSEPLIVNEPG